MTVSRTCPFCRAEVPDMPAHYAKLPGACPALAAAFDAGHDPVMERRRSERATAARIERSLAANVKRGTNRRGQARRRLERA